MEPFCGRKKRVVSGGGFFGGGDVGETHGECDDSLAVAQPALPFLFFDGDAADADDLGRSERVGVRQDDFDRHGLLVDEVGDVNLLAAHAHLDGPLVVLGVFAASALVVPVGHGLQVGGDDQG